MEGEKITIQDWENIYKTMFFYNKNEGFVDFVEMDNGKNKLKFFDSDPKLNGVGACYVTLLDVKQFIQLNK